MFFFFFYSCCWNTNLLWSKVKVQIWDHTTIAKSLHASRPDPHITARIRNSSVSFLHFHLLIGFTSCCSLPLLQLVSLMWDELRTSHMLLNNVFLTLVIRLKEPGNARSLHESMVVIGDAETEIMSLFKPFTCQTSAACSDLPGSPTTS